MNKPQIPAILLPDKKLADILRPIKENIEDLNGTRGGRLDTLPSSASNADIISKINEIINRLNI